MIAAIGPFKPSGDRTIIWKTMSCFSTLKKPPRMLDRFQRLESFARCFKNAVLWFKYSKKFRVYLFYLVATESAQIIVNTKSFFTAIF